MKKLTLLSLLIFASCLTIFVAHQIKTAQSVDQTVKTALSRDQKDAIILRALALELPITDTTDCTEADEYDKKVTASVYACNYEEAIDITVAGLKKFPTVFYLQADLASLLGDCAEITPEPLKSKMVTKAKELFARLLKEVDNQPKSVAFPFRNEYHFRLAEYKEQYELGIERVSYYWNTDIWKTHGINGYYCQGVGAAHHAKKLLLSGNKQLALEYAQKSLAAWAQYFSYENDYYNSYVHYAMALGMLGYKEEMMRALKRSASLIQKDLDYHEFKEVIDFINNIY